MRRAAGLSSENKVTLGLNYANIGTAIYFGILADGSIAADELRILLHPCRSPSVCVVDLAEHLLDDIQRVLLLAFFRRGLALAWK